jgi:hypothetical protein
MTYDMPEREFQAEVIRIAKMLGWTHFHPYRSTKSPAGYPDLTLIRDRVMFAELKTDTGRLTDAQKEWIRRLHQAGAEVHVWRPRDLQQIAETLARRTPHQRPEEVAA